MDYIRKHNLLPESSKAVGYTVEAIEKAMNDSVAVDGVVVYCDKALELKVKLGDNLYGVIKAEDVMIPRGNNSKKLNTYHLVGKVIKCLVEKVDDNGIILSRRAAQQMLKDYIENELAPGYILDGKVSGCEPYGTFVDIGCGLHGLIQAENISVGKIPCKVVEKSFKKGTDIRVILRDIVDGNISLSYKELLGTWDENIAKYNIVNGATLIGKVTNKTEFGIFVALTPNMVGLADDIDGYDVGDVVSVHIRSVIGSKLKVKVMVVSKVDGIIGLDMCNRVVSEDTSRIDTWVYTQDGAKKFIGTEFGDKFTGNTVKE